MQGWQGAANNFVTVVEGHLAGGDAAHLRGDALIDLVADNHESQEVILACRPEVDWLHHGLIEVTVSEPPVTAGRLIGRTGKFVLRHFGGEARGDGIHRNNLAAPVGQGEQDQPQPAAKARWTHPEWWLRAG